MNKLIMLGLAICASVFVGCDKLPTVEKMTEVSTVIGKTAGYVCELTKTKTEVKEAIFKVLDVVSTVVPTNGQAFVEAWTPVINEEVKKLIDSGKIDKKYETAITTSLYVVCNCIDYIFNKYPKAKEVEELVSAAVKGSINGYRSVVTLAVGNNIDIDEEAYKYLKSKMK